VKRGGFCSILLTTELTQGSTKKRQHIYCVSFFFFSSRRRRNRHSIPTFLYVPFIFDVPKKSILRKSIANIRYQYVKKPTHSPVPTLLPTQTHTQTQTHTDKNNHKTSIYGSMAGRRCGAMLVSMCPWGIMLLFHYHKIRRRRRRWIPTTP